MEAQRVQTLAATSLTNNTIPTEFIRPENEQPCNTTYNGQVPEIPTVDFSNQNQEHLVQEIKKASTEWGIFQIVNHGVPSDLMDKLQDVGKEFFESPQEEKEKIARAPSAKSIEGYGSIVSKDPQSKKAWADHLFHRVWPPSRINYEFWPKQPPYREVNEEYAKCMNVVADKLFKYLSLGLGLEGNKLKEAVGGEDLEYMLKINYYPPCPRPDLALGLVAHTDLSALTLLVPNEVPGLQVFKDDHWFNASYIPNAIIVHIGDQIEILSNGKYKSVLHRTTVSKDKTRMSWPMFLEPPAEMEVGPLPELINQNDPSKYKTKKFKDYAFCKLNKLPQ